MDWIFDTETLNGWLQTAENWMFTHVLSWELTIQIVLLMIVLLIGLLVGKPIRLMVRRKTKPIQFHNALLISFVNRLIRLIPFYTCVIILWVVIQVFNRLNADHFLMTLILNLSFAWIIIQLASTVILDRYWSRLTALIVWFLAALNIIDIFDRAISLLDNSGISIGENRLTLWSLLQAAIILVVLLKTVNWGGKYVEKQLDYVPGLNDSTRLMMTKVIHVTMMVLVTLIVLNSLGIDFSSLAIFSGAIGVGVGFGLQKVVGNYISGLILLSEKSIKPGDVLQIGDTFGRVRLMGGRYVSMVTRDEKEYLIPNEDLITQQVINWSYSSNEIRLVVPFGVAYKSNPHEVIEQVSKAVLETDRVLSDPQPACLLMGFGDSAINFELRFWINDPQNGLSNIKSRALLKIWDILKENNIEIPFPQRDIYIKSSVPK